MTSPRHRRSPRRSAGVTLIELAITIALVGIIGALMVQFVWPVRSYIDSSRRAALSDTADTALRRIGRDLRLGLPNSVRVTTASGVSYLELLLVRTGGRYRYDTDSAATNTCTGGYAEDVLNFAAADTCFKTLGNIPNIGQVTIGAGPNDGDFLVVFNLQPGTASADAYEFSATGGNKSKLSAATAFAGEDRIEFASNTFTYESPGHRFFIVEGPVSYICDPSAGTLTRRWGYAIEASQPTTSFTGGSSALIATNVSGCSFTYDANVSAGAGLATLALTLSIQSSQGDSESVSLYHAVHVSNVP
ncbi:MAG: prepilin-type N-terminal cleavage/methylation domain-containing protein [Pseudomonadota bacterium]